MPDNWRDALPDEIKGNESLAQYADVSALAAGFLETKALVGSGIRVPSEDASAEDKAAFITKVMTHAPTLMLKPDFENAEQSSEFFKTLGRPDDSAGYEVALVDEKGFNEARETAFRTMAHDANLTSTQYKALAESMIKFDSDSSVAAEGTTAEELSALKQEWGMAYDERKGLANKVRSTFLDFIPESQMDAQTIQALHAIGVQLGDEDGSQGEHRDDSANAAITPADALARIDDIMNNKEHPYWISMHPGNADALKQMVELRKAADPSAGTVLPKAGFGSG